jgi:predicted TIM-barrel fold metal-dependent hydrolase
MFPRVVSTIRGRTDIPDGAKEKILGANAARFYGWAR